jgi:4-hydroxy-4-methyl-2-oxoglutarate aldolase
MRIRIALGLLVMMQASSAAYGQDVAPPKEIRANRNTYSPLVHLLESTRAEVEVTEAQLEELASLQIEAIWDGLGDYKANYVLGFRATQPGKRLVGRALTMRFLPSRPDVREALDTLAEEGDWDRRYYGRAAEEAKPGDVVVVELGGASGDQLFGDVGALGMKLAGIKGAIIDGGSRDLAELQVEAFADFPVFVRYFDIDTSKWLGAEWNAPVRIQNVTVLPGDIVVADEAGALFFPPQLLEQVLTLAPRKVAMENHQRQLLRSERYRFRDVYPVLSPELQAEYERQSKPNK